MLKNEEENFLIIQLILKKINKTILDKEEQQLNDWKNRSELHKTIIENCLKDEFQKNQLFYLNQIDTNEVWKEVLEEIKLESPIKQNNKLFRLIPYLAAACILIVSFWFIGLKFWKINDVKTEKLVVTDYLPAENKAILRLSDGKTIQLNDGESELFVSKEELRYGNGDKITDLQNIQSVSVITPRSGYYKLTLPDGSKAELNASSSINYPIEFDKDKRLVQISGEVFFEVVPNKNKPFIVRNNLQEVEVLGTAFNINSYPENKTLKTTLVHGSIRVKPLHSQNNKSVILIPGQQSLLHQQSFEIKKVNLEQELAWKNGKFNFEGKTLREVMSEISRWYDIDVEIDDNVPDIEFLGGTYRNSKLSTILNLLENNDMEFKLSDNKKLIIKKSKPE